MDVDWGGGNDMTNTSCFGEPSAFSGRGSYGPLDTGGWPMMADDGDDGDDGHNIHCFLALSGELGLQGEDFDFNPMCPFPRDSMLLVGSIQGPVPTKGIILSLAMMNIDTILLLVPPSVSVVPPVLTI
jgi:hypothetical protein